MMIFNRISVGSCIYINKLRKRSTCGFKLFEDVRSRRRCYTYHSNPSGSTRHNAEVRNELAKLRNVRGILSNIDVLHKLVKNDVFIYDDRVQRAIEELRETKEKIGDYETLLKAIEIFHKVDDSESMTETMSYFSKDIPYIPSNILLQLTKCVTKRLRSSDLTQLLQYQLYLNTCSGDDVRRTGVENMLWCIDVINDFNMVYTALKSLDFSECDSFDKLLGILKLYHIFLSKGNRPIEGVMPSSLRAFESLLFVNDNYIRGTNGSIGIDSGDINSQLITISTITSLSKDKDMINCYRMLIKIGKYENFEYGNISNIINRDYSYSATDLVLLMRDIYYSSQTCVDESLLRTVINSIFDNIAQLSKDDAVLVFRLLNKYRIYIDSGQDGLRLSNIDSEAEDGKIHVSNHQVNSSNNSSVSTGSLLKLTNCQLDLLNMQVLLHMTRYTSSEVLPIVNYYSSIPKSSENMELMDKLHSHLNSIFDISNTTGTGSTIRGNAVYVDANGLTKVIGIGSKVEGGRVNEVTKVYQDPNTHIYTLSKLMLYFNSCNQEVSSNSGIESHDSSSGIGISRTGNSKLNRALSKHLNKSMSIKVKKYIRTISLNHINLSDKTVSYCLYTLYKLNHDPVKLVNQLLPSLHKKLDNSLDLVQMLLFFTRFRYDNFYTLLVTKVEKKLKNDEFNNTQLVIIAMCLCKYKKIFTNHLFTVVYSRLNEMSIPQICTVYNCYSKSGLNSELMINSLNQRLLNGLNDISVKDAMNLLLPIKKKYINHENIINHIGSMNLDPSDLFDVFGQIPMVNPLTGNSEIRLTPRKNSRYSYESTGYNDKSTSNGLTDIQVIKSLLCLSEKERSKEVDMFARELFNRIVKIVPSLPVNVVRSVLNSIQTYGYSKPKVNRVLTNLIIKHNKINDIIKDDMSSTPGVNGSSSTIRNHGISGIGRSKGITTSARYDRAHNMSSKIKQGDKFSGTRPKAIGDATNQSDKLFSFFRHISLGPPHLPTEVK